MQMPGLIVKKIGMSRMVDSDGDIIPVTILQVENQQVTKVANTERDGYEAVQVGYYAKREKRLTKADVARLRKVNVETNFSKFREFRVEKPVEGFELGAALTVKALEGITSVDVTGVTRGRGFSGAIKRWGSRSGRDSHGSKVHRAPGSLGMRTTPGRVFKGKHIPGHYGDERCTIQNLVIVDIDTENNTVALRGSVPGHKNGFLFLKPSVKK